MQILQARCKTPSVRVSWDLPQCDLRAKARSRRSPPIVFYQRAIGHLQFGAVYHAKRVFRRDDAKISQRFRWRSPIPAAARKRRAERAQEQPQLEFAEFGEDAGDPA